MTKNKVANFEEQTADERPESRLGRAHPRMPAGIRVYASRRA